MTGQPMSRRTILGGLTAAAALAAAGCSSSTKPSASSSGSSGSSTAGGPPTAGPTSSVGSAPASGGASSAAPSATGGGNSVLPAYVPFTAAKADLPALDTGVPPAFFTYPADQATFAKVPIGSSSDKVSVLSFTFGANLPHSKSAWWQNLEKELGIGVNLIVSPYGDYNGKLNTSIAGGDIPDIVMTDTSRVPLGALKKEFADLGPFLSGDKVKDYPGLAQFPTNDWKLPIIDGTLYGIQQPIPQASYNYGVRQDILDKRGIKVSLSSGQDLLALAKELADPKHNTWAFGQSPFWMLWQVMEMQGIPNYVNGWAQSGGKFTNQWEFPQMKDALTVVQGMWRDGFFNPDSANSSATWFPGGIATTYYADITNWSGIQLANPDIKIALIPLPKWDGGGLAVKQLSDGAGNFAIVKKADPDRVRLVLRFIDYLSAPFGTKEFLTVNYGQAGVDYTMNSGNPVRTSAGQADSFNINSLTYVSTDANNVLYTPGHQDLVETEYNYLKTVLQQSNVSAALGLYSATYNSPPSQTATKAVHDARDDILFNRKPVSTWDAAIKTWQNAVGNKIRSEYEAAYAKQQ